MAPSHLPKRLHPVHDTIPEDEQRFTQSRVYHLHDSLSVSGVGEAEHDAIGFQAVVATASRYDGGDQVFVDSCEFVSVFAAVEGHS